MQQRHIIIGDIHACADALFALLEECGRRPEDEVVSVGDLVDRGPDPVRVVQFFMSDPNARVILGNHEDSHLRIRAGELAPAWGHLVTQLQLGDLYHEALDWFATLPLSLERCGHFICHGGVRPDLPLDEQPRAALLRAKMPWMKSIFDTGDPWFDHYEGEVPVVYGHMTHAGGVHRVNNTWGIDTGAGHGGRLTALILPERRLVSVPASANLISAFVAEHGEELERIDGLNKKRRAKRKRARRAAKSSKPAPVALVVEGVTINGRWLLDHCDESPGPRLGELLRALRARFEGGELASLSAVHQVVAASRANAG